ncbi:type III secretion system export apparatus subunit SctS [Paludibacterium purpuratum]|uniref:Type III secretion protein S n=1 Tax=Paludibacterium purpuratum TaxID=1144873 RepID=A0A4R7B3N7_9NEIS|nr:type III secretion system export apparatus subunit SctS [Paludibacterium purpuratum]TDR76595.1 type III secretion protein S [Paludibacterium purpuratum]
MALSPILQLAQELLWLVLILSMPVVLVAAIVGILISLLQALTQVQDQTTPFLIKLVAASITLAASYHWMGNLLMRYTERSLSLISRMG